jgi:AraC-like DNA-binding protein
MPAAPPGAAVLQFDVTDDRYPAEVPFSAVVCTVHRAAWVPCWPEWSQPDHSRPWYTLYLCVGGGADYVVGGRPCRVDPGEALLLPPHVVRRGRHDPRDPFCLYAVHFSARLYGILDLPAVYRLPPRLRPEAGGMGQMVDLARRIVQELQAGRPGCVLAASGYCAALLALLVRETGTRWPPAPDGLGGAAGSAGGLTRLAPVFRLIEQHHAQPLPLGYLAAAVHLHPAYFSALFRRVTGMPPARYVASYRLSRVRELLLSTSRSVKEIAAETGFRDPSYLDRVFRRVEGVSPLEYRRAKARPLLP